MHNYFLTILHAILLFCIEGVLVILQINSIDMPGSSFTVDVFRILLEINQIFHQLRFDICPFVIFNLDYGSAWNSVFVKEGFVMI